MRSFRIAAMPTHTFTPDHYHTTLGSHPPVLQVKSGDTVVTTTVDAAGQDSTGEQVTPPGNPMTGPFFVEGAEPGDTLKVRLERITPKGTFGFSSDVVAPNVVDPDFVAELPERSRIQWRLEHENRTVTPILSDSRLSGLTLPFSPMIGCFGVAPAGGQAISTATSWTHGGNMDYRGFTEGISAYFPVFVPGALFFIGDVHALQGDGEIVGTGVEVASEVVFSLELLKGKTCEWPRGEDDAYLFTLGNARPLDQAVQHATTEMLRWLGGEYNLSLKEASILLGQCVRYDVGNVFDPAYTMVCKLPKRVLEVLG